MLYRCGIFWVSVLFLRVRHFSARSFNFTPFIHFEKTPIRYCNITISHLCAGNRDCIHLDDEQFFASVPNANLPAEFVPSCSPSESSFFSNMAALRGKVVPSRLTTCFFNQTTAVSISTLPAARTRKGVCYFGLHDYIYRSCFYVFDRIRWCMCS